MSIKVDVKDQDNIEYQYGVNLKKLKGKTDEDGKPDEIWFHILKNDENTLKRLCNLHAKSKSLGLYYKILYKRPEHEAF